MYGKVLKILSHHTVNFYENILGWHFVSEIGGYSSH
jgi:hypothetical protein